MKTILVASLLFFANMSFASSFQKEMKRDLASHSLSALLFVSISYTALSNAESTAEPEGSTQVLESTVEPKKRSAWFARWIGKMLRAIAFVAQKQADDNQQQAEIHEQGAEAYQKLADASSSNSKSWFQKLADWFRSKVAWFRGQSEQKQKQADLYNTKADYVETLSKACTVDSDCVLVEKSCCGCKSGGEYKAIHKTAEESYNELLQKRCSASSPCPSNWYGCDHFEARCENSRCVVEQNKEWLMQECHSNMQFELDDKQVASFKAEGATNISCSSGLISAKDPNVWWRPYPSEGRCHVTGSAVPSSPLSTTFPPPTLSEQEKDARLKECEGKLNEMLEGGMHKCLSQGEVAVNNRQRAELLAGGATNVVCNTSSWPTDHNIWAAGYPQGSCYEPGGPKTYSGLTEVSSDIWSLEQKKNKLRSCRKWMVRVAQLDNMDRQMQQCKLDIEQVRMQRNRQALIDAGVAPENIDCFSHPTMCMVIDSMPRSRTVCHYAPELQPGTPEVTSWYIERAGGVCYDKTAVTKPSPTDSMGSHGRTPPATTAEKEALLAGCKKNLARLQQPIAIGPCGTGSTDLVLQILDDARTNREIKRGNMQRATAAYKKDSSNLNLNAQYVKATNEEFREAQLQVTAAYNRAREVHPGAPELNFNTWQKKNYWKSACWKEKRAAFLARQPVEQPSSSIGSE